MKPARRLARPRRSSPITMGVVAVLLWLLAFGALGSVQEDEVQDIGPRSRFQRTVLYLQEATPELRSDFAATALASLARAYSEEASLARETPRLRSWSATVERYARRMSLLLEDVELGLPVQLTLEAEKSLAITVADRTAILSHPRLNEQSAFEQGILLDFCARHRCEQFSPGDAESEPIPVSVARIRPHWTFSEQQSLCAYGGITVRFDTARNMANARFICEQFLQEAMTLADELAWQQRHAVAIEWEELDIQPTPRRPEHMIQLNRMGDSVLATVPVIYTSPGLFRQLVPWLRQRLDDQQEGQLVVEAERFGWQKP